MPFTASVINGFLQDRVFIKCRHLPLLCSGLRGGLRSNFPDRRGISIQEQAPAAGITDVMNIAVACRRGRPKLFESEKIPILKARIRHCRNACRFNIPDRAPVNRPADCFGRTLEKPKAMVALHFRHCDLCTSTIARIILCSSTRARRSVWQSVDAGAITLYRNFPL